jgi:hypothetical protein
VTDRRVAIRATGRSGVNGMGSSLQAQCADCGLEQGLNVGGGFADFMTTAAVPAGCKTCHRLVTVNAKLAPPCRCPTEGCEGSPVVIGKVSPSEPDMGSTVFDWLVDDDAGTRYVLRDAPHRCPACGGPRLTFTMAGFRD